MRLILRLTINIRLFHRSAKRHVTVRAAWTPNDRGWRHYSYKFIVTGFTFHMFFGMMIPKPSRLICRRRATVSCTCARVAALISSRR